MKIKLQNNNYTLYKKLSPLHFTMLIPWYNCFYHEVGFCSLLLHISDEMAVDTIESEASQVTEEGEEFKVRCPCGCNEVAVYTSILSGLFKEK